MVGIPVFRPVTPDEPKETPKKLARKRSLSVMTWNTAHQGGDRYVEAVSQSLTANLETMPDILALQEVKAGRNGEDTGSDYARRLGYYWKAADRTGITNDLISAEKIGILSRFPFRYFDELHYEAQTSSLLLGFRRVAAMAEFDVPGIGLVRVVNVHLTNWGFEGRIRGKQIRETLEWMRKREALVPATVQLVCGDFNATPRSPEMALMKGTGTLSFQDFNSHAPTWGSRENPSKRIDYCFIASKQPLAHGQEIRAWPSSLLSGSDHQPIMHLYQFP